MTNHAADHDTFLKNAEAAADFNGLVMLTYNPGMAPLGTEDYMTEAVGRASSPETIVVGPALAAFFSFANVSKLDFLAFAREEHDIKLNFARSKKVPEIARAISWAKAKWETDPDKPQIFTPAKIWQILQEASYGGIPAYIIRLPFVEIAAHDFSKPMYVKNRYVTRTGNGKIMTPTGLFGLHDYVWGSGYIDFVEQPVTIPAGIADWRAGKGSIDDIYGIVETFFDVQISNIPPAPARQAS